MKPTSDNGRIVGLSGNRFCLVGKGLLMIPAGRQCSFWSSDGVLGNRPVPPPALPISPDIAPMRRRSPRKPYTDTLQEEADGNHSDSPGGSGRDCWFGARSTAIRSEEHTSE